MAKGEGVVRRFYDGRIAFGIRISTIRLWLSATTASRASHCRGGNNKCWSSLACTIIIRVRKVRAKIVVVRSDERALNSLLW